ncbi:MAG: hypothetical protein IJ893_08665 [Bacteroidales bacterium]|nr:hypothetical protein [Bacteroidales bacterium]
MKHTFRYILSTVLLLIPVLASAQTTTPAIYEGYNIKNGVATGKSVGDPDANGVYTVTLETFATGLETIIQKAIPSDIVLVLDYSSSMLMTGSVPGRTGNNSVNDTWMRTDGNVRDYLYSLKVAVGNFVKLLQENNEDLNLAPGQTGNRIAFVLYANEVYRNDPNIDVSGNGNFFARHVSEFIPVADMTVVSKTEDHPLYSTNVHLSYASAGVMYDGIDILSPSSYRNAGNAGYSGINAVWDMGDVNKGTQTGAALTEANSLVTDNTSRFPYTERSTTVVLFTDGEPSRIGATGFNSTEANLAISQARDIKSDTVNNQEVDTHVKVFTVGLLTNTTDQMKTFLEYVSSDFSPASEVQSQKSSPNQMPNQANYLDPDEDYGPYSSIVSEGADLSGVFTTIAESSGGSTAEIPVQTQVVDIVSSSFEVPEDFDASQVKVYTLSANSAGTEWGNRQNLTTQIVEVGENPPMTVQQPTGGRIGLALVDGKLTVLGFDFSKADQEGEDGSSSKPYTGNWVGWRTGNSNCAGKKLVIEFQIEANPDATGGEGTNTNAAGSGVYVPIKDANGNIIGYENVNDYDVPHKDLPINLVIKKTGLRHGESATIQIYMSPQKKVDGKVQYNLTTGKPLPEASQGDVNDSRWQNFSKVILTNLGEDGEEVTKTLIALDASYVYMLAEDNWGWAYILDDKVVDTSDVETNPITFKNTENPNAVKHAEAVSVNHFRNGGYAETAKSSKTKTFTTGTE